MEHHRTNPLWLANRRPDVLYVPVTKRAIQEECVVKGKNTPDLNAESVWVGPQSLAWVVRGINPALDGGDKC
jgi:hypothetical protein